VRVSCKLVLPRGATAGQLRVTARSAGRTLAHQRRLAVRDRVARLTLTGRIGRTLKLTLALADARLTHNVRLR
jgi:hypothetical protein